MPDQSEGWDALTDHERDMVMLAGKMSVINSWLRYAYDDIFALQELHKGDNKFVQLDDEFIVAAREATITWEDEFAGKGPKVVWTHPGTPQNFQVDARFHLV